MSFKLLIVEDNSDSRNLLHFLLTTRGFQVASAVDGQEGIYLAKIEKPDLIITDLTMPNLDGTDLIRQLRAEAETANIPILIYTAYSAETVEPAIQAGANRSFYKPVDLDAMLSYIDELLGQDHERQENRE